MVEQEPFSPTLTAFLPNNHGYVTLHDCVRLEVRVDGDTIAIYPIFQCREALTERVYGCLAPDTSSAELALLFPGIELEELDEDGSAGIDFTPDLDEAAEHQERAA